MEDIQAIKQRFEIIGNNPGLNRAIDIATQVAPTDLSVLITGESGVGKEIFPRIIHAYSTRKHAQYIAVNCGAIPEGTIDSELFGHEKGAFTGAVSDRKGYFEVTDGGTIFLDEVGELPLLFRKFAADFAEKYRMPAVRLTEEAVKILQDFRWPGNIRQLKNVTEQISIIERERMVDETTLRKYIPEHDPMLPTLTTGHDKGEASFASEREILYKILFDMKKDMNDLKRLVYDLMQNEPQQETGTTEPTTSLVLRNLYDHEPGQFTPSPSPTLLNHREDHIQDTEAVIEESF